MKSRWLVLIVAATETDAALGMRTSCDQGKAPWNKARKKESKRPSKQASKARKRNEEKAEEVEEEEQEPAQKRRKR